MKSKTHKEKLFDLFRGISILKGQEVPLERLELYVEYFSKYDFEKIDSAVFKATSENKWFPDVAEIMAHLIQKEPDSKQRANEIADDILMAVKAFGFYQAKETYEKLSPIARRVLKSIGLNNVCLADNEGMIRAQIRNLAETLVEKEKYNPQACEWLTSSNENLIEYVKNEKEVAFTLKKFDFEKHYGLKRPGEMK